MGGGLWDSGFNNPGSRRIKARRYGIAFVSVMFCLPSVMVYFGATPSLLSWWLRQVEPIVYAPQADASIIRDIYHGRQAKADSMDNEPNTNR